MEAKEGKESTFRIHFPASSKIVTDKKCAGQMSRRGSGTVLLVDDEEAVVTVARELLEELGYETLIAREGERAVALYEEKDGEIDLVLLDMVLPGMGGGEIFNRLRELNPGVRVLLSSGYSLNGEVQKILDRGCAGFIQKPYGVNTLTKAIDRIMGE